MTRVRSVVFSIMLVSLLFVASGSQRGGDGGGGESLPPIAYNGDFTAAHYEGQQVADSENNVLTVRRVAPSVLVSEGIEDMCEGNAIQPIRDHFQNMSYPPGSPGYTGHQCSAFNRNAQYSTPATVSDTGVASVQEFVTRTETATGGDVIDEHWAAIGRPIYYPVLGWYGVSYWAYLHSDLGADSAVTHLSFSGATYGDGTWLQQGIGQGFNVGSSLAARIPQFFYQFKPAGQTVYQPIRTFASPLPQINAWNGVEIDAEPCCWPSYNSHINWRMWFYTPSSGWVNPGHTIYTTPPGALMARNVQITAEEIDPAFSEVREYFPYIEIYGVQGNSGGGYYYVDFIDPEYQSDASGSMLRATSPTCPPLGIQDGGGGIWYHGWDLACSQNPF